MNNSNSQVATQQPQSLQTLMGNAGVMAKLNSVLGNEKKAAGVVPTIVDMVEIQQAASKAALEELRSLYKEGKVKHHETLNGHAFSIKE